MFKKLAWQWRLWQISLNTQRQEKDKGVKENKKKILTPPPTPKGKNKNRHSPDSSGTPIILAPIEEDSKPKPKPNILMLVLVLVLGFLLIGLGLVVLVSTIHQTTPTPIHQTTPTPSNPAFVGTTWLMGPSDYANNRWFADGILEIKNAKNNAEASNAAYAFLEKVKHDPLLLAATAKSYLNRDADKATLIDKNSWATDTAVQLVAELQITLGQSKVALGEAPKDGYNSGVANGVVVGSRLPGISGDRKAIQIDLPDGRTIWIMGRCGNIVTPGKPSFPPGETDEKPLAPTLQPTLQPKSSNPDDYKQPGDGTEKDSGTSKKPVVPFVTAPPESLPPPVEISRPGGGGVVDSIVNTPGTESGIVAPGATTPKPAPTVPPRPTPEPGVNPTEGPNQGDPGNPFS